MWCRTDLLIFLVLVISNSKALSVKNKLSGVSWSNCGSVTDPVQLISLEISPDSIHLPGEITISAEAHVNFNVTAPIKAEIELKKKTFLGWLPIPCVDDFGSCTYDDVCSMSPYENQCPEIFQQYGIPCHCPIDKGTYKVDDISVDIKGNIPHWIEKGHYKGQVKISEHGEQLACYEFESTLK